MNFKKTNLTQFLGDIVNKLKGDWLNLIATSLIFAFLVFTLTDIVNVSPIFGVPLLGFVVLGQIDIIRKMLKDEEYKLEDLFKDYKFFVTSALTLALVVILVSVGLLLLIVPGLILAVNYSFAMHILEEKKEVGSLEALRQSKEFVNGYRFKLGWFYLLFLILGVLAFALGLVVALPLNLIWGLNLLIIAGLVSGVLGMVFIHPLFMAGLTGLYDEIKADRARKAEEKELEEAAEQL